MDSPESPTPPQTARFTMHVPRHHASGHELPTLLDSVRDSLTAAGIHGRTVHKAVESDLGDERHHHDLIRFDASDDPQTRQVVQTIGEGVKQFSGHPACYVTIQPLETWLL